MEGGHALADVLLGRADATGRLPFTVVRDPAHLPAFDRDAETAVYDGWHGWWRLERDGHQPRFPFGFGLSYTSFELGEFAVTRQGDDLLVLGTVRNTGGRQGSDVVQVYGGRRGARPRPLGVARVGVAPRGAGAGALRAPVESLAPPASQARPREVAPGAPPRPSSP